jgi:hypothetical protein
MKTPPDNASNAIARSAIRNDIATRVARGAKVNKVLYGLTDEQLIALMLGVTDLEVGRINEVSNLRLIASRLPYADKVMDQIIDAVGPAAFTALNARTRALALSQKAAGNSGHLVGRAIAAMSGYLVGAIFSDVFSSAQLKTLTGPLVRTLGEIDRPEGA